MEESVIKNQQLRGVRQGGEDGCWDSESGLQKT